MTDYVAMLRKILEADIAIENMQSHPSGLIFMLGDAAHVEIVRRLAGNEGWITTRADRRHCSIEPSTPDEVVVAPGCIFYHVSDRANRDGILKDGLEPRWGGNTTLNREYPGRVHLSKNLAGALAFTRFQTTSRPSTNFDPLKGATTADGKAPTPKMIDELDIYAVTTSPGFRFHHDCHFVPEGLWTPSAFDIAAIRLMERTDWRPTYDKLYPPDPPLEERFRYLLMGAESARGSIREDDGASGNSDSSP